MTEEIIKVQFCPKKGRVKDDLYPIYGKIIYLGKDSEFNTRIFVENPKENWDRKGQYIKGKKSVTVKNNDRLKEISVEIKKIKKELEENKYKNITALMIKLAYTGELKIEEQKEEEPELKDLGIIKGFEIWKEIAETMVGAPGYSQATIDRYGYHKVFVKNFIAHKYGVGDFAAKDLDTEFITGLAWYSPDGRVYDGGTISNIIGAVNRVLEHLAIYKHLPSFTRLKPLTKPEDGEPVHKNLPDDIMEDLKKLVFKKPNWKLAVDLALFQREVGTAYADTMDLTHDKVGIAFIKSKRRKTKRYGRTFITPYTVLARELMEKYRDHPLKEPDKVFPHIPYSTYQRILKNIGIILGMHITSHMFRHTFGTKMLEIGYSLEAVSLMLGITITMAEKVYAEKNEKKLINEKAEIDFLKKQMDKERKLEEQLIEEMQRLAS